MLKSFLCNGDVFDFSESRDIKLLLWLLKVYASVKFYSENKNLKKKGTPLCDKVFSDQTNTTKDGVPYEK